MIIRNKKELDKKTGRKTNKDDLYEGKRFWWLTTSNIDKKSPSKDISDRRNFERGRPNADDADQEDPVLIIGRQVSAGDQFQDQKSVKVKHIFEINVVELRNFAILKKIIKDIDRGDKHSVNRNEVRYIQDVFVKYIFPLDDEQIVSDYVEFSPRTELSVDYKVSMHSYHNYVLEPNMSIMESLSKSDEWFTISLSWLKEGQEMNIGNHQMPIEDLIKLVEDYEAIEGGEIANKFSSEKRKLVFYGTVFSQRENCIIGKLDVEFKYKRELVEASSNRQPGVSVSNDLYLQKEVFMNRRIPLNGYLNVEIGELSDLKYSLDNIYHLISLYNDPDSRESLKNRTLLNANEDYAEDRIENIDHKRAILKIKRDGLNLAVVWSIFEQTDELKQRFGTHQTGVVFQTLHPNFNDQHEYRIKMDEMTYEHLKYRAAVFEIRHYFIKDSSTYLDLGREEEMKSDTTSEFQTDNRDYFTLGYARVPLVNMITKTNGVDQNIAVLDNFSQKLGYIRIKMSLNYQSKKRLEIYKQPEEKENISGKYFLGFSFVELISQHNKYLQSRNKDEIKHLVFKFKWNGINHQIRYIPENISTRQYPLDINVYFINKMCLIDFDIDEATFEKSTTPIEIQLWTKVENKYEYLKDRDELIGSVFIGIQSLIGQKRNNRLKFDSTDIINSYDGYYTIINNETDSIKTDRLGITTMLIKNEYNGHKEALEKMFYIFYQHMRSEVGLII